MIETPLRRAGASQTVFLGDRGYPVSVLALLLYSLKLLSLPL